MIEPGLNSGPTVLVGLTSYLFQKRIPIKFTLVVAVATRAG